LGNVSSHSAGIFNPRKIYLFLEIVGMARMKMSHGPFSPLCPFDESRRECPYISSEAPLNVAVALTLGMEETSGSDLWTADGAVIQKINKY
jgi:hypothetical protein